MADRYEVLGHRAEAQVEDVNTDPSTQGVAAKRALTVIYSTDDFVEVNTILESGGYVDSSDVYWIAIGYRDTEQTPDGAVSKSEV